MIRITQELSNFLCTHRIATELNAEGTFGTTCLGCRIMSILKTVCKVKTCQNTNLYKFPWNVCYHQEEIYLYMQNCLWKYKCKMNVYICLRWNEIGSSINRWHPFQYSLTPSVNIFHISHLNCNMERNCLEKSLLVEKLQWM